ncbi:MAG: hypothetical protein KGL70_00515 [Betaproteobacteria bacterium]|nr:hypothetical protein [Betaproteobacteria bacterium]MBU6485969.1 hypothetical protein [Betaproteobacteria bacterium]MDE2004436.1 hypothetical protein [Betaproteobacteria bacterium]MDE2210667.1 hypothetical protein [Betaproteobacteria bacterium]MDE2357846.1 hypothetical protein [Betaproteobacteria bacterium]
MNSMPMYLASAIRVAPRVCASVAWAADGRPVDRLANAGIDSELTLRHPLQY